VKSGRQTFNWCANESYNLLSSSLITMSTLYVDEATGSDETGKGTQELPYKSLAFAVYSSAGLDNVKYLIRKDATTDYDEATQSALKKAKKGADGIEKKKKKAEELAAREDNEKKAERERKEKLLDESKKIVLEEDPALPEAIRVNSRHKTSL
jgi:asparaginyl-tRNA synthetase